MYCIFLSIINSSSPTICYLVVDIGNPCRSSIYDFTHLIKKIFALRIFRVTDCLYSVKGFKKIKPEEFSCFSSGLVFDLFNLSDFLSKSCALRSGLRFLLQIILQFSLRYRLCKDRCRKYFHWIKYSLTVLYRILPHQILHLLRQLDYNIKKQQRSLEQKDHITGNF